MGEDLKNKTNIELTKQSWFFWKDFQNLSSPRQDNQKSKKMQMNKMGAVKDFTIDFNKIQIIKGYFENLYYHNLEKLQEMDKFPNVYNLLKLDPEERTWTEL